MTIFKIRPFRLSLALSVLVLAVSLSLMRGAAQLPLNWAPNIFYAPGKLVTYGGVTYKCLQSHTSQAGWEPATTPALWQGQANPQSSAWGPNIFYAVGRLVTHNGRTYRCLQAHTSQPAWNPAAAPTLWRRVSTAPPAPTPTPGPTPNPTPTPAPTPTPMPMPTPTPDPNPTPGPNPGDNFPNNFFAPYVDMLLWPTFQLTQTAQSVGTKYYSLAFITSGGGCQAAWGGIIPISDNFLIDDIRNLRAIGGNVIISFGGANGVELGQDCGSVGSLQAQYQAVIDRYNLTRVDFDIEGAAAAQPASIDRRNKAIAGLQARARAQGRTLVVSYTLPTLPTGLPHDGLNILRDAVSNGVVVARVNIMAMDYGGAVANPNRMGQNAIDAANSLLAQMRSIFPGKTDSQLRAMTGITPMIGLNDVHPEVFTLNDAQLLYNFAWNNGIGLLSMWSMGRDKSCPGGGTFVAPDCSGIAQQSGAFANFFKNFTR